MFGNLKSEVSKAYDPDGTTDFAKMLTLVNTDKVWAEPARFTARAFTAKGAPAYLYLFSYVPTSLQQRMPFGASHASEISFVFDDLKDSDWATYTPKDKEIAKVMNAYWVNFARTGNPNGIGLPQWPMYNSAKNEVFEFKQDGSAGNTLDQRKERLDVIEKSVDKK